MSRHLDVFSKTLFVIFFCRESVVFPSYLGRDILHVFANSFRYFFLFVSFFHLVSVATCRCQFFQTFFSFKNGFTSCKKEERVKIIFLHQIFRAKLYVLWRNVFINFNKWRPTVAERTFFYIVLELNKEKCPISIKKLEKLFFWSISPFGKKSVTVIVSKRKKHFFVLKHFILFFIFTFWCFWHHQRHVATHDKVHIEHLHWT